MNYNSSTLMLNQDSFSMWKDKHRQPTGHLGSASSKVVGAWDEWDTWP